MSTRVGVLSHLITRPDLVEHAARTVPERSRESRDWENFEQEQLRALVRQVFFPGWPRPARQVVLSAIDEGVDVTSASVRIGKMMAAEIPGNVAVIETLPLGNVAEPSLGRSTPEQTSSDQRPVLFRKPSRQILSHLWLVPSQVFVGAHQGGLSASWLRGRLSELRLEFDYVLINAPAVNQSSEAALLGSLTDGVILTVAANRTRRVAAQKSRLILRQANARLLGVVLCERTFPVPERLYRKL